MKTIILLADSVNRRCLSTYGNTCIHTPNLERLGRRSHVFENHWTGSAPCMPARRDIFTGRLSFLERGWGPLEAFDEPLTELLRKNGVRSHMVSDHYHYLEYGGEGYCQSFDSRLIHRGQEHDNIEWPAPDEGVIPHKGMMSPYYTANRGRFVEESDFTSPKTYRSAAEWLHRHGNEDDFLLWVEGFDPHEPFDTPDEYLKMYDDIYSGPLFIWPEYAPFEGTAEELRHIRARYAATLTMTDRWIGRILDVCDELSLWNDTMIIFTTDHGYMLGEHGFMAKNYMPAYNEVFHIPLMIHRPGQHTEHRSGALTQNIDLFPTIASFHGVDSSMYRNPIHGRDLTPLLDGSEQSVREAVVFGIFGKSVNLCDGRYTYFKAPVGDDNTPLNLYMSMPTTIKQRIGGPWIDDPTRIEMGRFLRWTEFPVYRIPADAFQFRNSTQSTRGRNPYNRRDYVFDLDTDYAQTRNVCDSALSAALDEVLIAAMKAHDSPPEQFQRLGLA